MSPSTQFISSALSAASPTPLSYTHKDLKWLIRDHLLSLLAEFPSLSPSVASFTHPDGTTVILLNAGGPLPTSPPTPLTIWLHQNHPFTPPVVFLSPIPPNHPFVDPSSGSITSPYLDKWQYPNSDLSGLARELVKIFTLCPNTPNCRDRLVRSLHNDKVQFRAEVEKDIEHLSGIQAELIDRASFIDSVLIGLDQEKTILKRVTREMAEEADVIANWLRVQDLNNDESEVFEAADERSKGLMESEAAELAIDDVVEVLGKALEEGVVGFGDYIKQVRALSREHFFHRALLVKLEFLR